MTAAFSSAFSSAFSHRLMILWLAVTATARFLAAMMNGIDGGPGAALGFLFRHAAFFVALLDVAGLTFFFVGVFVFVTSWHFCILLFRKSIRWQLTFRKLCAPVCRVSEPESVK